VETLVDIIISGEISQNTKSEEAAFKWQDIDFGGHQIGKVELNIPRLSSDILELLEDEGLFSFAGFWKILSTCVGEKFVDKKNST
jgi:hypothetical protein